MIVIRGHVATQPLLKLCNVVLEWVDARRIVCS
jgi:hypothetical protein